MTKYVLKRLLYMVIVFLLVSLLMYSIYNLIPTDPARAQLEPMKTTLKPAEYEQRYQMLRQQMGLNDPLIVRYLRWIGFWPDVNGELNGMLQGNFGYSQIYKTDVANVLPSRMLNTIYINIFSPRSSRWRSRSRSASTAPSISAARRTMPCRSCPSSATPSRSISSR